VAFVSGYGLLKYVELFREHFHSKQWLILLFHFIFIGWMLYSFAFSQVYYVYLKFGFAYPHFGVQAHLW